MNRLRIALPSVLLLVAAVASADPNYSLPWNSFNYGGIPITSTSYALNGSLAQPVQGTSSSTSYAGYWGFWYGVGPSGAAPTQPGWMRRVDMPAGPKNKNVKDGGCIAYKPDSTGEYVYALKGNGRYEFYRYDVTANTWTAKESIPAIGRTGKKKAVKKGAAMTASPRRIHTIVDSACYPIPCVKGNNTLEFWQYDPRLSGTPTYPWRQLAGVPPGAKAVKEGAGMVRIPVHDSMFVYLLKGSGTQEFHRYNRFLDAWERMVDAPLGASGKPWKSGSCIAYDSINKTIYALKGSYNELYAYDIATNTWTAKASLPLMGSLGKKKKAKDGAGMAWLNGKLYAQKGNGTLEFWSYSPATDAWTQTEDMPVGAGKAVKGGGAVTASSTSVFSLKGNNTLEFYSYTPAVFNSTPAGGTNTELASLNHPNVYALSVAPNPLSRSTEVNYSLSGAGNVELRLYDVSGALVKTLMSGRVSAGSHATRLDATKPAHGIYFLKLVADGYHATNKLIIE